MSAARRSSLLLCEGVNCGDRACPEGFLRRFLADLGLGAAFSSTCCFYVCVSQG